MSQLEEQVDRGRLARIATLEQLLEVYERTVIEQSATLYEERHQLTLKKNLLSSQGEASIDGILSVSVDGRILFMNRRFGELWDIEPQMGVGLSYRDALDAMARSSSESAEDFQSRATVADDAERRDELTLSDGRILERYTAPIIDDEVGLLGRVWHFRDVTKSKRNLRLREEFIASVSHELRTPLTSIRGVLDLMAAGVVGDVSPEALALVKTARSNCERLSRLIDDVLDIERIEAGRMLLRLGPLELESVAERSIEAMKPYGSELGVHFSLENSAPGGVVCGDGDRLIQVMENLLSNAAKYSHHAGEVRVGIERWGAFLRVTVTDQGCGIPQELQDRIFERFTPREAGDTPKRTGTGLGLSIARAIVEHHRGTIDFESVPGEGSTFYFSLPEYRAELEDLVG